ncbi:hypothetical protein [Microcella alkaliphila]|uniref:Integral membrane protein n=1 Tax=Microcella alkaliphila TaxID=279828 RepID=A0A0U5BH50_9MICO|nr:hypothetical protein [Microcella alkaliphila]BAU32446.1 uncharacterized protein MalAC0309_1595 [Microcella alkaliphila]
MVVTDPRINDSRRIKEAMIRVIDIITYAAVLAGGFFAVKFTPDSVLALLEGWEWVIGLWALLLIIGGLLGFIGRLTRVWAIEVPGTGAGIAGALIYAVVLANIAFMTPTALVAEALVVIATLTLLRRYIELQIFTTEPGEKSFTDRLAAALKRRTTDTVGRHR